MRRRRRRRKEGKGSRGRWKRGGERIRISMLLVGKREEEKYGGGQVKGGYIGRRRIGGRRGRRRGRR